MFFCTFVPVMRRYVLLLCIINSLCCVADNVVRLTWTSSGVKMKAKNVAGVTLKKEGGYATVENSNTNEELQFELTGRCLDGGLKYVGDHKVTFVLDGLQLESKQGSPMNIKCGKRVAVKLKKGTHNELTDAPDSTHKGVLRCKGHLEVSGAGALTLNARGAHAINAKEYILFKPSLGTLEINATGDGCKGIRTGEDFTMRGGDVTINTSGNYAAVDTTADFPPFFDDWDDEWDDEWDDDWEDDMFYDDDRFSEGMFPGGMSPEGMFPGGMMMPDSAFIQQLAESGFPMGMMGPFPFGGDSLATFPPFGGDSLATFPPFEGDSTRTFPPDGGMPFMRGRFIGTTKGIKALGKVSVEGGNLVVNTCMPGAEGIEGKNGVELSRGTVRVNAYDDAINGNGPLVFSGADVRAVSTNNDAVDSNAWGDGSITISGGHVEVFSGIGPPEEGFDSDQWAIVISGGEAFSVGSGMGPFPSLPNERTATQPYLLFQFVSVKAGDELSVCERGGEEVMSVKTPVANPMNHSLVTSPALQKGGTYVLKVNGAEVRESTAR